MGLFDVVVDIVSGDPHRRIYVASCIAVGAALYWLLGRRVVSRSHWLAALFLTPIGILVIMTTAWWIQEAQPILSFSDAIRHGAHAALFGDIVIAIGLGIRTYQQRKISNLHEFWTSRLWFFLAYIPGLVIGLFFHASGGPADSQSPDLSVRMHDSATSWAHNLGVMPGIAATLIYTIIPLLFTKGARKYFAINFASVVLWGAFSIWDTTWRAVLGHTWGFNPHWLDTDGMQWSNWWERFGGLWQMLIALF